jgi:hypothetical protein
MKNWTVEHWRWIVPESVNHPPHYGGDTTYEAIKVIDAWGLGFCLGNTVKYIARAGRKDPCQTVQDLEKAAWYLRHEIERLKAPSGKDAPSPKIVQNKKKGK